jgi:hypothetical protein
MDAAEFPILKVKFRLKNDKDIIEAVRFVETVFSCYSSSFFDSEPFMSYRSGFIRVQTLFAHEGHSIDSPSWVGVWGRTAI